MGADFTQNDCVADFLAGYPVVYIDADFVNVLVTSHFFIFQRRVSGVIFEQTDGFNGLIDDGIRNLIINKASSDQVKDFVIKEKGFKTLRDNALEKWSQGMITLEEVVRVTSGE